MVPHPAPQNAKKENPRGSFWVGIEGGAQRRGDGIEVFAWIVIQDVYREGLSRTSTFSLPPGIVQLLDQGIELGHANDLFFGESHSKQKGGAVGSLTNQMLSRTEYYIQPVLLALVPFLKPELYYP